jgi:hypothetical protein
VAEYVLNPGEQVANWEFWLAASAHHHKRISYLISSVWIKVKIQSTVSITFFTVVKLKNQKLGIDIHLKKKILLLSPQAIKGN